MPAVSTLDALYRPIAGELGQVRAAVSELWNDVLRLVDGSVTSPPDVGGKLLRPAMCLLSAGASGAPDLRRFVPMATAMEMFHLAALAHDDVIDDSSLRRGAESLNAMWNDHAAVLGGDYLVARGIALLATYDKCDAIANAIECIRLMAEGELTDFGHGPSHFTEQACIALARAKTASLFGVACNTPSYVLASGCRESFYKFGLGVGTAFQLVDDVLDLAQDEATLGKPSCNDLVRGKKTLPILFMREGLDPQGVARLDAMRGRTLEPGDREWIAEMLESTHARRKTESVARRFIEDACAALDHLAPSVYRDSLFGLAEFVVMREK